MTNQSIKLNREIAREKKVSPEESDHIWECNEIRQATASETTEMYCALKSCRTRTCGGSAQPLLHALSLASETCVVLSLDLELELQIKGNHSKQGNESSVISREKAMWACLSWRLLCWKWHVLLNMYFQGVGKAWAAWPNDLLTGQHLHSQHCRAEDSQAIEYFISTWWTRFCINCTQRINPNYSVLGSQLCLEICSARHFMSQLLSSIFPKARHWFFLSSVLCLTSSDWCGLLQCFIWISAKCCPKFSFSLKKKHNKIPIITGSNFCHLGELGFFLLFAVVPHYSSCEICVLSNMEATKTFTFTFAITSRNYAIYMSSALQRSAQGITVWAPGAMGWRSLWAGLWRNLKSRKVEIKQPYWDRGRKIFVHSLHQGLCQPWVFICQPGGVSSVQAKEWGAPFIHGGQ